jgi:hypothetical protein
MLANSSYENRVSAGLESDAFCQYKFGFNGDVDSAEETVWEQGGIYAYPAAATVMKVSSANANDTAAGTGARTVQIYGLDANYALVDEIVTLNGQTAVNTVNSYLRVYRMIVLSAGSGGQNAGVLYAGVGTVTSGVPATVYLTVTAGNNQTLMAFYTVPAGYKALLKDEHYSTASSGAVVVRLVARAFGQVFATKNTVQIVNSHVDLHHECGPIFDEKTDIEVRASCATNNADVSASFALLLFRKVGT